ncbi:MAG: type II secretion system protein [Candidatus Liptonbacteria bacterium]
MSTHKQKGFTLIELLVVIAIVAVLSVVVILTLNPAELLKQARDSSRISDAATLKSAISLYMADYNLPSIGSSTKCYMSSATTSVTGSCGGRFTASYNTTAGSNSRAVDGSGWLPVDFTKISSGAPIGNLPVDPVNDMAQYYYAYAASTTSLTFEITAKMESSRYNFGGSGDVTQYDGGRSTSTYEVGTVPGLAL